MEEGRDGNREMNRNAIALVQGRFGGGVDQGGEKEVMRTLQPLHIS